VEPRHGIDINEHLDLVGIVVASMPRAKWLRSDAVYPEVLSEGWLGLRDALRNFDPAKGRLETPLQQRFRSFAGDHVKGRILKWQVRKWKEQAAAGRFEPLEDHYDIAVRPLTPGDHMGLAADPVEAKELVRMMLEVLDELPPRVRDDFLRSLEGWKGKEIAADRGLTEAAISQSRTRSLEKVRAGVHRALQTPMKPKTVAEVDAQIDMLFPVVANLALQRQQFKETMSIDGFEVDSLIGEGGHAEVWLARKRGAAGSDRLVALKRLLPERTTSNEAKRRFEKEVRTSSKLTHQNIVYYDTCVCDNGLLVLVMEYIDGRDLAQLMDERTLSRDTAVYLIDQVLAGLRHAHGRGIVHRDIKPSNILVSRDGAVKVSDFGLAQAAVTHPTAVRSGVTLGTRNWMSPEHEAGERVDERSDLFAVGLVLRAVLPDRLDAELKAYVEKLTCPAPEDRFQSALEALEALPKCDHRQATRELAAYVQGEAIPVDEARPSGASLAPPSTAPVTSPHAVLVTQPASGRWVTNPIALLVALLLLFVGATGMLVGQLWSDEGEMQGSVAEVGSKPAPAVAPVSVPAGVLEEPEDEPPQTPKPSVQQPASRPAKRKRAKRPPAQSTKNSTEKIPESKAVPAEMPVVESAVAPAPGDVSVVESAVAPAPGEASISRPFPVEPVAEPLHEPNPEPVKQGRPRARKRRRSIPRNPYITRPPIPENPYLTRPPTPGSPD
jgi:RNA polymerase sigma factor (sigma-70 family)